MPLQDSTTDQRPDGSVKLVPSRSTGMPLARTAATVKSAVQSISVGSMKVPNGTANSRNASGNAIAHAMRQPSTSATRAGTIADDRELLDGVHTGEPSEQPQESAAGERRQRGPPGFDRDVDSSSRLRQTSHALASGISGPCANDSLLRQTCAIAANGVGEECADRGEHDRRAARAATTRWRVGCREA